MSYSIIVLQNRHCNAGHPIGEWRDTLYYSVLTGWERDESGATHFLRRHPSKDDFIQGYSAGCTAQDMAIYLKMHEELVERGVTLSNRIVVRHIQTSRKEKDVVMS